MTPFEEEIVTLSTQVKGSRIELPKFATDQYTVRKRRFSSKTKEMSTTAKSGSGLGKISARIQAKLFICEPFSTIEPSSLTFKTK